MKLVKTIEEVRSIINDWKSQGQTIGFVPTMGFLHKGHASLMQCAAKNDKVVVSIFVNPIQFGPKEDLKNYPRDLEHDLDICQEAGVDLVFHPNPSEMYEEGFCSYVEVQGLTQELCGVSRPTHFRGVCTVVSKLFHIVKPNRAYFGEKDAQQLAVIKRMVKDLNMDIEIVGCPIIREEDGLALSSRNMYLKESERNAALILSKAIELGRNLVLKGEKDVSIVIANMQQLILTEPLARIDYIKAVDKEKLQEIDFFDKDALVAMAVYIGETRLIDNFLVRQGEVYED